jgi:hypothetical protein
MRFKNLAWLLAALLITAPFPASAEDEFLAPENVEETQPEMPWEDAEAAPDEEIPSGEIPSEEEPLSEPDPGPEPSTAPEDEEIPDEEPEEGETEPEAEESPAVDPELDAEGNPIPDPEPSPSSSPAETPATDCNGTGTKDDPVVCVTINGGSKTVVTTWSEMTVSNNNPPNVHTTIDSGTITEEYSQNADGNWILTSKSGSRREDVTLEWSTPNEVYKYQTIIDRDLTWEIGELGEIISSAETPTFQSQTNKKHALINGKWVRVWDQDLTASSFEEGEPLWDGHDKEWNYSGAVLTAWTDITYSAGNMSIYKEADTNGDGTLDIWTRDNDADGTIDASGAYGENIA